MTTRKRRRKSGSGGGLFVLVFVILGLGIATYRLFTNMLMPTAATAVAELTQNGRRVGNLSNDDSYMHSVPLAYGDANEQLLHVHLVPMYVRYINDTGYLALINRQHPASTEVDTNLLLSAWPTVPVSRIPGMYLHSSALGAVAEMFDSARTAEIGSLFVSSGFRSYEDQISVYDGGANAAFALPPGHSEHHTGLAVDIMATGIGLMDLGNSPQGRWLGRNSYRYGLILRYPEGAEAITGIQHEPWHFRYVGRVHAYFMRRNNLVLEEYIELIQSQGSLSFDKNGTTYFILFQEVQNGMLNLPYGMNFTISNDNSGGYIITAWE